MCALTNPVLIFAPIAVDTGLDMRGGYVRGILVVSIVVGLFCLLIGDWLVVAAMTINSFAMARLLRRRRL